MTSFLSFHFCCNCHLNGCFRGSDWRDFQDCYKTFLRITFASLVRPSISAFSFWVSVQVKDFNFALPDGLAAKDFCDRHGLTMNRSAVVKLRNGGLQSGDVISFILHSVPPVQQLSMRSLPRPQLEPGSCGLSYAFSRSCNKRNSMRPQLESFQTFCCKHSLNE